MNRLEPGQEVETTIVAISGDTIFLDLNAKSEGVLDAAELTDKEGKLTVKEGDVIKAYFLNAKDGEMHFTVRISGDKADSAVLENAYKNRIPVEGCVEKEIKGGFEVKICGVRAFCPYSQMGFRQKEAAETFVGKHLTFLIQEYKEKGRNVLVSNRAILEDEYAKQLESLQDVLKVGMTVDGTVKSLQKFGAFVDINGFQALLPISEISRSRVENVADVLSVGQTIKAVIIKADWQNERMSLSMKSLEADPWDDIAKKYPAGTKINGTVSRVADFGVFVTVETGIDGLVHISELQDADDEIGANTNIKKRYVPGDKMSVVVKSVDVAQHRISLQLAASLEQEETARKYMNSQDDGADTYNPFAALLKKK